MTAAGLEDRQTDNATDWQSNAGRQIKLQNGCTKLADKATDW